MNYLTPSPNSIVKPVPVSGASNNEQIVIRDINNQEWLLVAEY